MCASCATVAINFWLKPYMFEDAEQEKQQGALLMFVQMQCWIILRAVSGVVWTVMSHRRRLNAQQWALHWNI